MKSFIQKQYAVGIRIFLERSFLPTKQRASRCYKQNVNDHTISQGHVQVVLVERDSHVRAQTNCMSIADSVSNR